MSNPLSVRRLKIQGVDGTGHPKGDVAYVVLASDNFSTHVSAEYESLDALNDAIEDAKSMLALVDPTETIFSEPNHALIGKDDDFYGKDWCLFDLPVWDRLAVIAEDKGVLVSELCRPLGIDPDRLNDGSLNELISLAIAEGEDAVYIEGLIHNLGKK